ncbi:MAG: hypothetical protein ABSG67_06520 [Thermoguttaceae bacterium]
MRLSRRRLGINTMAPQKGNPRNVFKLKTSSKAHIERVDCSGRNT